MDRINMAEHTNIKYTRNITIMCYNNWEENGSIDITTQYHFIMDFTSLNYCGSVSNKYFMCIIMMYSRLLWLSGVLTQKYSYIEKL